MDNILTAIAIMERDGKTNTNLYKLACKAAKKANNSVSNVTFKRVSNGVFEVYKNDNKTSYTIINGCLGMSGNGKNIYLIMRDGERVQGGLTLARAKKLVTHWIKK